MAKADVKALFKTAYERRSLTAHVGVLHGAETTLGYLADSDFCRDDAERFEVEELAAMRDAARAVLIQALSDAAASAPS